MSRKHRLKSRYYQCDFILTYMTDVFFYLGLFLTEIACNANRDLVHVDRNKNKLEKLFYNFWILVMLDIVIFWYKVQSIIIPKAQMI